MLPTLPGAGFASARGGFGFASIGRKALPVPTDSRDRDRHRDRHRGGSRREAGALRQLGQRPAPLTARTRHFGADLRHGSLDLREREGLSMDGSPLCCHASTRKGTACQRVPLPGSKYCPSHKHLDEEFEVAAA